MEKTILFNSKIFRKKIKKKKSPMSKPCLTTLGIFQNQNLKKMAQKPKPKGAISEGAQEYTGPLYLFQVFSAILWFTNEYKLYATIIITTLISLFIGVWETKKNLDNIQTIVRYSFPLNILRKESNPNKATFVQKSCKELDPWDSFELQEEGITLPWDCLLIQATAIINETMLIDESTHIIKSQIPQLRDHFNYDADKKYFLFSGTVIVWRRSRKKEKKERNYWD